VLQGFARPPIPEMPARPVRYTFAATHDLTRSLCQRGHVVSRRHASSIAGEAGPVLAINGTPSNMGAVEIG
jgi:hypothetical protein